MGFTLKELYIIKDYVYSNGIQVQIELGRTDLDNGDIVCLKEELNIINNINIKLIEMINDKRKTQ